MNTILTVLAAASVFVYPVATFTEPKSELLSKELVKGELILMFRVQSQNFVSYGDGGLVPESIKVWREIYGASNGVVVLKRRLDGKVTPESTTKTPERVEWPE